MDPEKRTTKVIIDLVNAGDSLSKNHHFGSSLIAGGYFEDKLKEYGEYLNEELLEKFFRRIEMAEKYEVIYSKRFDSSFDSGPIRF